MAVDSKWVEATNQGGGCFTRAELDEGWPEKLNISGACFLQWGTDGAQLQRRHYGELLKACKEGRIPHATETIQVRRKPGYKVVSEGIWGCKVVAPQPSPVPVEVFRVSPADFKAWLDAYGAEPSPAVCTWLERHGVKAGADVVQLALKEPAIPSTWPELVAYRKANERSAWTTDQRQILVDERLRRGNQEGAAESMANELGVSVSRLNELITKAGEQGMREAKANKLRKASA